MAGEKVRIKIRHDRHGVIYPRGAVVVLPPNVPFDPVVLHELLEPAPSAPPSGETGKAKGKGKAKAAPPPADDDLDGDDSP